MMAPFVLVLGLGARAFKYSRLCERARVFGKPRSLCTCAYAGTVPLCSTAPLGVQGALPHRPAARLNLSRLHTSYSLVSPPPLSLSLPWCSINTPARSRGALGNNRNREVDLTPSTGDELNRASSTDAGLTSDVGPISRTVIWGTDVNVQDTQDKFTNFFTTFLADNQDEPKYLRLLAEVCTMPPNPPSLSLV